MPKTKTKSKSKTKPKNKKKIYLVIFSIFILFLIAFAVFFTISQKNKAASIKTTPNSNLTEITPPPVIDITWDEAQKILDSCQVVFIFQRRNLEVTMTTKDQIFYKTKQPKLNDIIYKINHLPSVCTQTIEKVTE